MNIGHVFAGKVHFLLGSFYMNLKVKAVSNLEKKMLIHCPQRASAAELRAAIDVGRKQFRPKQLK